MLNKKHLNYKETESIIVNYFDNNIKMTGSHLDQIKLHRTDTKLRYTVSDNSLLSMNKSKWGKIIKSVWRMLIVNKLNSISKKNRHTMTLDLLPGRV